MVVIIGGEGGVGLGVDGSNCIRKGMKAGIPDTKQFPWFRWEIMT